MNAFMSLGWLDELQSNQCLWRNTSPNFGGTGGDFPCKNVFAWIHSRDYSLVKNFNHLAIAVQWTKGLPLALNGGYIHSKITVAGDVVHYYTVTALVPTLK